MIYFLSFIIPLPLLIPNLLFLKFAPTQVPVKKNPLQNELILTIFERVGQMGVFIIPIFYRIDLTPRVNQIMLFPMIASLLIYYGCWGRYFFNNRNYVFLFRPLWGIPIPMAIFPIWYLLFASKILNSPLLLLANIVLAIGHIPISYREFKNSLRCF